MVGTVRQEQDHTYRISDEISLLPEEGTFGKQLMESRVIVQWEGCLLCMQLIQV